MASRLAGRVGWVKVGLEAFVAEGPGLVSEVAQASGAKVFLDLKFHDIPATVAGAVASAGRSGAAMVNVHASGGRAMLEAARDAARRAGISKLIAVTVLTSIDAKTLADLPMAGQPEAIARRLSMLAKECGLDGVGVLGRGRGRDPRGVRPGILHGRPGDPPGGRRSRRSEARRDARRRRSRPAQTCS